MFRSRLRASVFLQLTGENRLIKLEGKLSLLERCNVRIGNSISLFSVRNLLFLRTLSVIITKRVENPEQSPDSSSDEDEFSELGPPVGQGTDNFPKSMTERPQRFRRNTEGRRHALSGLFLHATRSPSSVNEALEQHSSSSDQHFRLENLKNSSSNDKADKFLESGSSFSQGMGPIMKLMTEKPCQFTKTKSTRNVSAVLSPKSSSQLKDEALRLGNSSSSPHLKLESHNSGPRSNIGNKQASDIRSLNFVTVQKIPSAINLPQLKEAISIFGKILNATMRTVESGLTAAMLNLSVESSRKALSVGWIMVNNFNIPISPLHVLEAVTMRISNLNSRTDDSMIHSVCKSYGNLDTLVRTKDDAVDALFFVKDKHGLLTVLEKLNNTMMDGCKWSAYIQPPGSPSTVVANEKVSQQQLGLQIHQRMLVLLDQLSAKNVYMEDLENLHCALMHLDSRPMNCETKAMNKSQK